MCFASSTSPANTLFSVPEKKKILCLSPVLAVTHCKRMNNQEAHFLCNIIHKALCIYHSWLNVVMERTGHGADPCAHILRWFGIIRKLRTVGHTGLKKQNTNCQHEFIHITTILRFRRHAILLQFLKSNKTLVYFQAIYWRGSAN